MPKHRSRAGLVLSALAILASSGRLCAAELQTLTNSIGMKLVLIPAGEFDMGSPESEAPHIDAERPVHRVRITEPFYRLFRF
jgi:formylglycine-generating enzyme required for sulfatase activity